MDNQNIREAKFDLHTLTSEINTCTIEVNYFMRGACWLHDCINFVIHMAKEMLRPDHELEECLEYLLSITNGVKLSLLASQENVKSDFQVVSWL